MAEMGVNGADICQTGDRLRGSGVRHRNALLGPEGYRQQRHEARSLGTNTLI